MALLTCLLRKGSHASFFREIAIKRCMAWQWINLAFLMISTSFSSTKGGGEGLRRRHVEGVLPKIWLKMLIIGHFPPFCEVGKHFDNFWSNRGCNIPPKGKIGEFLSWFRTSIRLILCVNWSVTLLVQVPCNSYWANDITQKAILSLLWSLFLSRC